MAEAIEIFLGLDPGKLGGLACLLASGDVVGVYPMPDTEPEIFQVLAGFAAQASRPSLVFAALEWSQASPRMGVVSAFTYGAGFGGLKMALTALNVRFELMNPVKWQNRMGCRSGGDKNITKAAAKAIFPAVKMTHQIADALLLAEYGRRRTLGLLPGMLT